MRFTDIFIKRPVLATVVSLFILALGFRAYDLLSIRQFPATQNAVITVTTSYIGADPDVITGFLTTPLELSLAQTNGIDYMTSTSTQSTSTIQIYLRLNYDANKALAEINARVNAVLNQLPKNSQLPVVTIAIGQTIDSLYIGFYSDILPNNKITDYITRVVQPKLQTVPGVQTAEILGGQPFAMRIWLDPKKLAGFGLTAADIGNALANNDVITAAGRTDGKLFVENITADTGLTSINQFENMVIKSQNNAIIRLRDIGTVSLGATNYDSTVSYNGKEAVYIGILVAPSANVLTVIDDIKKVLPSIFQQLPHGLKGRIVYDTTEFIHSSIREVRNSLFEALIIVTLVIFLFLGEFRSVTIPVIAIPLSLIGTFFIMLLLGYSINLLTLLAFVLAIGLVVDDAIIVVENVQRHMEDGMTRFEAALQGARELANPIIAISVVLIAVYLPIGFMGGLTGALFTEFAFTLAAAVGVSAVIALTLSPMMCSRLLKLSHNKFEKFIERHFKKLHDGYAKSLHHVLNYLPVIVIFTVIVFLSIYFLYSHAQSELAPQEDQGVVFAQLTAAPNASLEQTQFYSRWVNKIFFQLPETDHTFIRDGFTGLNTSFLGLIPKLWDERKRTTNELQPIIQAKLNQIPGVIAAAFQLPSLPGARGLPIQFVINSTDTFDKLDLVNQDFLKKVRSSGLFAFVDTDLKIDKAQTNVIVDRDKASELGFTMQDVGNILSNALSQNYINYFNLAGRSYQVIAQVNRGDRLYNQQILHYYITTPSGQSVPLSTIASLKNVIVPESLNHFQQLNAATLSAVMAPGVTMGEALNYLENLAKETLPEGFSIDFGGQSRQFMQEGSALLLTFFFAIIIIYLSLAALFESFRDPFIILISVPMSICGALIFISFGVGGSSLNIYTEVGLVTLIGLISKHGILIVQFANDLQKEGKQKRDAIEMAATIRFRPILMTTASMVLGVVPLLLAVGAGAVSRFNIGLVIAAGISIGTLFTLFVVPAMYMIMAENYENSNNGKALIKSSKSV